MDYLGIVLIIKSSCAFFRKPAFLYSAFVQIIMVGEQEMLS